MGRRRRRAAGPSKAKPKLDTSFDCPYCMSTKSVEVKLQKIEQVGRLNCRVCNVTYQMRIHALHDAVDVYSEWVDEATEKRQARIAKGETLTERGEDEGPPTKKRRVDDGDLDGFVVADDVSDGDGDLIDDILNEKKRTSSNGAAHSSQPKATSSRNLVDDDDDDLFGTSADNKVTPKNLGSAGGDDGFDDDEEF